MAERNLAQAVIYGGVTYGPGPVETNDLPEGVEAAWESKDLWNEEPRMSLTDHGQADPGQPNGMPPDGESGDEDLTEAPPAGLVMDTRAPLPGAIPYVAPSDEASQPKAATSTRSTSRSRSPSQPDEGSDQGKGSAD